VPYAVVRPCALTEEPAGAPLELDQGDVIKVGAQGAVEGWVGWGGWQEGLGGVKGQGWLKQVDSLAGNQRGVVWVVWSML